jgi:hypothetical protein
MSECVYEKRRRWNGGHKLNLDAAERFLSKLHIRHRDTHRRTPFVFNFNQQIIHRFAREQQEKGLPIRIIVDKSRRVGVSSWTEGILFCHCLSLPGAHALVAAHKFDSSKALFDVPRYLLDDLAFLNLRPVQRSITFPHGMEPSKLEVITAGKETTGRGYTLSALHLSECSQYKNPDVFSSILPALSNHKDTINIIESTPNGTEGDGEAFYEMWMDAIEGRSEYKAVFLSWTDDPACVADPEFMKGDPLDEEEKELLGANVGMPQLAWRRLKIASPECGGMVEIFHQEYAWNWKQSFIVSGMPAFEMEEIRWAKKNIRKPKWQGYIVETRDGSLSLRKKSDGDLRIWEDPIPGHYYYIGMDAARGEEGRDFSAMCGFDGTTGHQVFSYNGYVVQEILACWSNSLGRHYNKAMINGDLTGGYGTTALYVLRDLLHYSNLYRWKGKDDKIIGGAAYKSLWLDITSHIRTMLFEIFRASLREGSGTDGEFGITLYDDMLATQVERCTRKETFRIDVSKGHDDLLFAAMIADLSMHQWAPPRNINRSRNRDDEIEEQALNKMRARGDTILDDASLMLQKHHKKISNYRPDRQEDFDPVGLS